MTKIRPLHGSLCMLSCIQPRRKPAWSLQIESGKFTHWFCYPICSRASRNMPKKMPLKNWQVSPHNQPYQTISPKNLEECKDWARKRWIQKCKHAENRLNSNWRMPATSGFLKCWDIVATVRQWPVSLSFSR